MSNPLVNPFLRLRDPSDQCLQTWMVVRNVLKPKQKDIEYLKANCPYEYYKYETLHHNSEY